MRKQMFFPNNTENSLNSLNSKGIISYDSPIKYEEAKNILISREIKEEEYDEVHSYLNDENKMISGIYTLLPKDYLIKYMKFDNLSILMRAQNNKALIGTIMSILFPIRCFFEENCDANIIVHGCTTYLNVHSKLRGHGLCMALIRELSNFGHEKQVYCSYSLTAFPLSDKSFEVSSWYRPLNAAKSIALGFIYPDWNSTSKFLQNRLKYNTKMPKKYTCDIVKANNKEKALEFYLKINESKKFAFYPDLKLFSKWIEEFPTYIISFEKKIVGLFSIGSICCRMENGMSGELCVPLLFNSSNGHSSNIFKSCIYIANEKNYDVLYTHCSGDITEKILKENNCIQTPKKSYFSLYNNSMNLTCRDLYVPLI